MRLVILHYHLFKNAGSTIEEHLDRSFGSRFGKLDTSVDGGIIGNSELIRHLEWRPDLCAFSSHQIRHPLPETPGFLFFDICFLRDPIDRLRSFYTYFRQKPNPAEAMNDLANRSTLGEFITGMMADFPLFVKNNQVNLLACQGDSDGPEERDLEVAVERMRATSLLGVVDRFDPDWRAGAQALRIAFPELTLTGTEAVNVSDGMRGTVASRVAKVREACGEEVFGELKRMTALDQRLVELARIEVQRRGEAIVGKLVGGEVPQRVVLAPQKTSIKQPLATALRRLVGLAPYWRELSGNRLQALFDADYYRRTSGVSDPSLIHFLVKGAFHGLQPHPLFDPAFYLRKYPDVAATGVNPLLHYIRNGAAEDRKPHPLFEPGHYRAACGEAIAGPELIAHFLSRGSAAANPHPLFDCAAYLAANPDAVISGTNPLIHYLDRAGCPDEPTIEILDAPLCIADTQPQQLPFLQAMNTGQLRYFASSR